MFWNFDRLNTFQQAAIRRALKAWDDRIAATPLRDPDWISIKQRAEREDRRARLWINRKLDWWDAYLVKPGELALRTYRAPSPTTTNGAQ